MYYDGKHKNIQSCILNIQKQNLTKKQQKKKSLFKFQINTVQNQHTNVRMKNYNKYASTWISAIYGGQNALQESLCEGVWMNQLFLQDREQSGTGCCRELCTCTW